MANIKSAIKRARQTRDRNERNRMHRSRVRGSVRAAEEAIAAGDREHAQNATRKAESELASAGRRGLIHQRAASRKISRLAGKLRTLTPEGRDS